MSKKILVIGCGHVGSTIADVMEDFGNEIIRIDPTLNDKKAIILYPVGSSVDWEELFKE